MTSDIKTTASAKALNASLGVVKVNIPALMGDRVEAGTPPMREDYIIKDFATLVREAYTLALGDLVRDDPVAQDCFMFWAIGGFMMDIPISETHAMWVQTQHAVGWNYAEEYSNDQQTHWLIREFDDLSDRVRAVDKLLDLVCNSYASGQQGGAEAAMLPMQAIAFLLRTSAFNGHHMPKDMLSTLMRQTDVMIEDLAAHNGIPAVFRHPLNAFITGNIQAMMTNPITED